MVHKMENSSIYGQIVSVLLNLVTIPGWLDLTNGKDQVSLYHVLDCYQMPWVGECSMKQYSGFTKLDDRENDFTGFEMFV